MYLICESYDICGLVKLVNENLNKGYACQGGVCVTSENEECGAVLYQAMIIKDESNG